MKKRGMRLAAIGMMTAVLLTVLSSCTPAGVFVLGGLFGAEKRLKEAETEQIYSKKEETQDHAIPNDSVEPVALGDYVLEIKECKILQRDEKRYALVTMLFQNNSEEETSFSMALEVNAYQNGIEADRAYLYREKGFDFSKEYKDILPGAKIEVQKAWELTENGGVLTLTVKEYFDYGASPYTIRFNLPE